MAAGVVLAASMACGAAAAQTETAPREAVLSGTVLLPDGEAPAAGATVALVSTNGPLVQVKADSKGEFQVAVEPGQYDIVIWQSLLYRTGIRAADLHAGQQILQPISLPSRDEEHSVTSTVGGITVQYPVSYFFKHPIRYIRNLRSRL